MVDLKSVKPLGLGEEIAWGSYSTVIKPSNEWSNKDNLLLLTVEEDKASFLKGLYSMYSLGFKNIGEISSGIFAMSIPRLSKVTIFDMDIDSALGYVNDHFSDQFFYSGEEFEKSPSSVFNEYFENFGIRKSFYAEKIECAIGDAFYALRMNKDYFSYRIDLHDKQFCKNNDGQIICIDPVIFE